MRAEVALIIFFSSNTSHVQQITATVALNVIYKAGNAKLIIFPYTQPGEAGYLWRAWVKKKSRTADTSDPLFLAGEVRHMGPPHITHLGP